MSAVQKSICWPKSNDCIKWLGSSAQLYELSANQLLVLKVIGVRRQSLDRFLTRISHIIVYVFQRDSRAKNFGVSIFMEGEHRGKNATKNVNSCEAFPRNWHTMNGT